MNQSKTYRLLMLGGAVGALALIALAWLFVVGPEFSRVSSLNSQTADAQSQNILMQSKVKTLQTEFAKLPDLQGKLSKARLALPTGTNLSDYTRTLAVDAASSGVNISSLTTGTVTVAGSKAVSSAKASNPAGTLYAIPLTLVVKGPVDNLIPFAEKLEGVDKRAALVTSAAFSGDPTVKGGGMLGLQLSVFAAPQTPAEQADLQKLMASTPN